MKKFCISTLTHDDNGRKELLEETIKLVIENTNTKYDWFILVNSSNESWVTHLNKLKDTYKERINFSFRAALKGARPWIFRGNHILNPLKGLVNSIDKSAGDVFISLVSKS